MRKAFAWEEQDYESAEFEGEKNRERDSRRQLALMICVGKYKIGWKQLASMIEICNYLLPPLLGIMTHMQASSIHFHMVFSLL